MEKIIIYNIFIIRQNIKDFILDQQTAEAIQDVYRRQVFIIFIKKKNIYNK